MTVFETLGFFFINLVNAILYQSAFQAHLSTTDCISLGKRLSPFKVMQTVLGSFMFLGFTQTNNFRHIGESALVSSVPPRAVIESGMQIVQAAKS